MQRRDLLKLLTVGAALPAFTPDLLAVMQEAQPSSRYVLQTLNPHQNATVVSMIDLIIPATELPARKRFASTNLLMSFSPDGPNPRNAPASSPASRESTSAPMFCSAKISSIVPFRSRRRSFVASTRNMPWSAKNS